MTFSEYKKLKGINASLIKAFISNPLDARDMLNGDDRDTPAFKYGRLLHTLILEPTSFRAKYQYRPATYTDAKTGQEKPWNENANVCKEWWANRKTNRDVVTDDEYNRADLVASAVREHPLVEKILAGPGFAEFTAVHDDPVYGKLKARLDYISTAGGGWVADVKTMQDASDDGMAKSIADYNYHIQASFYLYMANAVGFNIADFYIIAIESNKLPARINVKRLDRQAIEFGGYAWQDALPQLRQCIETNNWPEYSGDTIGTVDLPEWKWKQIQAVEDAKTEGWEVAA